MAQKFRVLLGIIAVYLASGTLYAETLPGVRGFNQDIFQYHFDRADRETDPSSWMEQARLGREFALGGWERTALELYADPALREEAEREIALWSEEELERRFTEWLFRRFFAGSREIFGLTGAVDSANKVYAYHTGEDGNIAYNAETGEPEAVRPQEERDAEADREAWRALVLPAAEAGLASYADNISFRLPEILCYIPEEQRSGFQSRIEGLYSAALSEKGAEFRALLAREERLFVARRTGDVWSLRRQSESESASAVTARLLEEAGAVCAAGIASLETRMESARAGTGDLALAGENWLEAFREQFERGLKAWEAAEENFLVRRMEWERDSGEYFLAGQEAWENAFARLEQERLLWEDKAKELFEAGEKLFSDASLRLRDSIAGAKAEFERDAELRTGGGVQRVEAWVDMYVTCGSVLSEVRESVSFWLSRFVDQKAPANALESGTLGAWVENVLRSYEQNPQAGSLTAAQKTAAGELVRWSALYVQYRDKAAEAKAVLEGELALALGIGSGPLSGVPGMDSENFHLDEYQVEILRAQAAAGYWQQRLAAAEAVSAYARDITAGRLTEAESLERWKNAKAAYDAAVNFYAAAHERLNTAGLSATAAGEAMREAASALAGAERRLEELNSQYALQMAAYRVNSGDFILEELGAYYASLVDSNKSRTGNSSYYTAYLSAARDYSAASALDRGRTLLGEIAASPDTETRRMRLGLLCAGSAADWYFVSMGIEAGAEERAALELEGVGTRLVREAENNEQAARLLGIYRELAPFSQAARRDAAGAAERGIVRVFAAYGVETAPGRLPPVNLAGAALADYCAEYGIEIGEAAASLLVRIGRETEFLPDWIDNELESWKQAFLDYMAAKTLYGGFAASGNAEAAAARYEELSAELEARYFAGESIEALVPEAAYSRYLYRYLSSYENYLNESERQDAHWRVYITSPFLDEYNLGHADSKLPQGTTGENGTGIGGALSFEEGLLADAREAAEYERKKLESAFALFTGIPGAEEIRFAETAERLLSEPEYAWEYARDEYAIEVAREFYLNEAEKLQNRLRQEESIKSEIARLGSAYEKIPSVTAGQLEALSSALNEFRAEYQNRLEQYKTGASAFAAAGAYYESLYTESKNRFDAMEKARLEYEKQDAVQRWASTAYLKQGSELAGLSYYREPEQELAYVRERNERAQVALRALKDLYGNEEEKRPYNDAEYNRLYTEYQASFTRMFLTHKARQEFEKSLASEKSRNAALYGEFSSQASAFLNPALPGYLESRAENIVSGAVNPWFDYLRVNEQGRLALAYNPVTFKLDTLSAEEAAGLSVYFRNESYTGNGENQASSFEKDIAAWTGRMASYNLRDPGSFQRWGLALDYLVRQLVKNNSGIEELKSSYTTADFRESGDVELDGRKLSKRLSDFSAALNHMQEQAWIEMSGQEKSDLQFLAAMLLAGGGDAAQGLTQISELKELEHLAQKANSFIWRVKILWFTVTIYEWPYFFDHSELNMVLGLVNPYKNSVDSKINASRDSFNSEIRKTAKAWNDYDSSCKNLGVLTGLKENGATEWGDLKNALKKLDLSGEEINLMEGYWNNMLSYYAGRQQPIDFSDNAGALEALMIWARGMRNGALEQFEAGYAAGENFRREAQSEYRSAFDAYINGEITLDRLNASAEAAYGSEAPAFKNHLENLGSAMLEDLSKTAAEKNEYAEHYRTLASEYAALIRRSYQARFAAELSARELEWAEREKDLNEKILAWREAAALVLERGRADWKSGAASMQESCARWAENFTAGYERTSAAWNAAYLESLMEKEAWVNRAMEAADGAYTGALLASVGSDAEALSRRLDVFVPSGLPAYGSTEEAEAALNRVFAAAGIANLSQALSALSGGANTAFTRVRSGTSGIGVWNAGQAHAAARELAGRSTADLAAGKMAILALQARETALAAKQAFAESVENANRQFDDNMDETFVMGGGWSRSGKDYVREVIVHSTFFEKMITKRAVVGVYRRYVIEQWDFVTDFSESYLEGLDYLGIQALIGLAQKEVQEKSSVIFGSDGRMGEFDRWIGSAAVLEKGKVTDRGSGELGRLLTEYYTWSVKQTEGIALANRPLWDKPLWDSRGSWFSAPSLRTIADIGVTLVSAALAPAGGFGLLVGVAINLADDFFFSTMDVALGHKSLAEAGFAFGQKILTTAASSAVGTLFNGFAKPIEGASGFFNEGGLKTVLAGQTASVNSAFINPVLTGVQTLTTSSITSALSSVTYDDKNGFGWSKDGFNSGLIGGLAGAASGSVSTLTSGLLNTGLEGFYGARYVNGQKLSSLAGGLAGEGINYAFGGDITLNPLNLGSFNGSLASTGLLELHFGKNGFNAGLGMGGVDISAGTLASAALGLEAWKVNFEIWSSDSAGAKKYISQMRTLYSGGNAETRLYEEILAGKTRIYENKNVDYTETIYDPVTGYKNILLGEAALNDGTRFGLNVVFSHEVYRNGINDGEEQQKIETAESFAGHVKAAYGLITAYGEGVIDETMTGDAKNYGRFISAAPEEKEAAFAELMQSLDEYDSSGDYWKRVKRSDGSYGLVYDENHSLVDEKGNILVKSYLDKINARGKIIGHEDESTDAYMRSLGTLMGLYPDFGNEADPLGAYREFSKNDGYLLKGIFEVMTKAGFYIEDQKNARTWVNPRNNGSVYVNNYSLPVNSYLMTLVGIATGSSVTVTPILAASVYSMTVDIKDRFDKSVGTIQIQGSGINSGERDYIMIENMIPEGRRLKAGTISVQRGANGVDVRMFGLGSTMPDPSQMGKNRPALADGTYRYEWSLHNPMSANAERAFRLFSAVPDSHASVTGPRGASPIADFNYSVANNWGNPSYRTNFPGYYYVDGIRVSADTSHINGHAGYSNPFISHTSNGKTYTSGSEGCLTWPRVTFNQVSSGLKTNQKQQAWGNFYINRSFFGDGTNGKNNWWNP